MEKVTNKNQQQKEKKKVNMNKQTAELSQITLKESSSIERNNKQDVPMSNKNDEMEILFASDEMLESIQFEDSTVEIIGYIDEIDGPKLVGKAKNYQLLKFILNNNSRHRVQVVVWNNDIERIQYAIKPNRIIHVDGAKAKRTKIPEFNQGTLPYEIIIRSNTIINSLGSFDLKKVINVVDPKLIELLNLPDSLNSCVLVRGYIKTRFNSLSYSFKTIGTGSITDGRYKLEIQVSNYEPNDGFEKGEFVEIKGYVKVLNDIFYLDVETISDIKLIGDQTLSLTQLLQGTKSIMKRSLSKDETLNSPSSKIFRM